MTYSPGDGLPRGTTVKPVMNWIGADCFEKMGYLPLEQVVGTDYNKLAEASEALARIGYVHQVECKTMNWHPVSVPRVHPGIGWYPIDAIPAVKQALLDMEGQGYSGPFTSASAILEQNAVIAFKKHDMAVLFRLLLCREQGE